MKQYITVFITAPSEKVALKISRKLLREKIIACANIIPKIRSLYTWKNKLCDDKEVLVIIKTKRKLFGKLKKQVLKIHPYDVPEIISLPILEGHHPYINWINKVTI